MSEGTSADINIKISTKEGGTMNIKLKKTDTVGTLREMVSNEKSLDSAKYAGLKFQSEYLSHDGDALEGVGLKNDSTVSLVVK